MTSLSLIKMSRKSTFFLKVSFWWKITLCYAYYKGLIGFYIVDNSLVHFYERLAHYFSLDIIGVVVFWLHKVSVCYIFLILLHKYTKQVFFVLCIEEFGQCPRILLRYCIDFWRSWFLYYKQFYVVMAQFHFFITY